MKYFEELKGKLAELELDEEKVNELVEFSKKTIPKEFVPSDKYAEVKEELNSSKGQLEAVNKNLEELKQSTESVDEYKTKLDQLNQEYNEFKEQADTRVAKIKKWTILKDSLLNAGADKDNVDLLMNEFNLDELKLNDDGNDIIGKDEYIQPIKEKRARLFVKKEVDSNKPPKGDETVNEDDLSPEELVKLRLEQRGYKK